MVRRRTAWRAVGCLIKVPLGCGAFLIGGAVVFALFAPMACGRAVESSLQEEFNRTYMGNLELHDAWVFSLLERQSIDRIVLRDPEGVEILSGRWSAPSLLEMYDGRSQSVFDLGRLNLVYFRLREDENGVTNLGRALSLREGNEGPGFDAEVRGSSLYVRLGDRQGSIETRRFREHALELAVEHLSWSRPGPAGESELVLRTLRGRATLRNPSEGEIFRLALNGRILGEDEGELDLVFTVARPGRVAGNTLVVDATEVPLAPLDDLLLADGMLATAFGAQARQLHFVSEAQRSEVSRVELDLRSEDTELALRGVLDKASLTLTGDEGIRLKFAPNSWWAKLFFGAEGLLPLIAEARPAQAESTWSVTLSRFSLPLDRDVSRLFGRFEFDLGPLLWRLPASFYQSLGIAQGDRKEFESNVRGIVVEVEGGRVRYEDFVLFVGDERFQVEGSHDLRDGAVELLFDLPIGLVGDPTARERDARGSWDDLVFSTPGR